MKAILGLVVFLVVAPVIAIGIFVLTFDPNAFKNQVTQQVSQTLGREVTVAGPVNLSFHNGVALGLKQVSIGNPAGFPDKDFAKVDTLFVSLNWQALLMRKVDVSQVTLSDASLALVTNTAGKNNGDFDFGKKQPVPQPPGTKPQANIVDEVKTAASEGRAPDLSINSVALNNVEITNASVTQVDMRGNKRQEFAIKHAQLKIPASGTFHAEGSGAINGAAFDMRLDTKKSLREVKEGTPIPLDLHLAYGNQTYDVKADLSWKGKTYRLASMDLKAMGASFSGDLTADLGGALPYLTGNITTPEFNLTHMSSSAEAPVSDGKLRATPIVAAAPAQPNLAFLRSFNSDLGFATPKLVLSGAMALENVSTRIKVASGVLTLDPLKATYNGQPWQGMLSADASANVRVALRASNVDYEKMAASFGGKSPVNSHGDISFDLTGRGLTAQAFMATMNGRLEATMGPGDVAWNGNSGLSGALTKTLVPNAN
ncbi:MAG TPA: AsmA family protein, partial [Alphaproteobacteria bacterium]|nr:AsmA family protein [Alphaproteobacteria bacterium]